MDEYKEQPVPQIPEKVEEVLELKENQSSESPMPSF
jgi:hypothetical protein